LFLIYCLLEKSPDLSAQEQAVTEQNLRKVVTEGRRQNLDLNDQGQPRLMLDWAEQLFADLMPIADWMDAAHGGDAYRAVIKEFYLGLLDPNQTYSGKLLSRLVAQQQDSPYYALALAEQYRQQLAATDYQIYSEAEFEQMADQSLREQQEIEQADDVSFDQYLERYFADL
jgi:glutamate--cysteine ligase